MPRPPAEQLCQRGCHSQRQSSFVPEATLTSSDSGPRNPSRVWRSRAAAFVPAEILACLIIVFAPVFGGSGSAINVSLSIGRVGHAPRPRKTCVPCAPRRRRRHSRSRGGRSRAASARPRLAARRVCRRWVAGISRRYALQKEEGTRQAGAGLASGAAAA
eukprot:363444-Chlamydomonas_euryale.AAC.1